MSEPLEIQLLGKDYRVACEPEEREGLLAAVAFLDGKLKSISAKAPKSTGGARSSGERTAVMAALNIAHELLLIKAATPDLFAGLESETIEGRINSIERKLDASLAEHGQLP
jgi:cell division protein ZapA